VKQFKTIFEHHDKSWIANCEELRLTLEEGSFDALVIRMKMAIQDIAQEELGYNGNINLLITTKDRIEEIRAVG